MLLHALSAKFLILYIYILSVGFIHFRGKVRLKWQRQIFDHSTLVAPINALIYFFSAVPNKQFFDVKDFPQLEKLRENWQVFREEAQQLVAQGYIKATENNDDLGFNSFFKRGWKRFYLKWYDDFHPSAKELCPKSVELLKSVPGINAAMFTLLPKNGGRLKEHRDPYAGSIRYHLGLITPNSEQCRIYIDGIPYYWKDGEGVLFDETYIHTAKNDTDMDRIILFCDVERPLKTKIAKKINYFFCKYVMSESTTQNLATDRVGFINKAFKQYHRLSQWGARLRSTNRPMYYVLKYGVVLGVVYLIFF